MKLKHLIPLLCLNLFCSSFVWAKDCVVLLHGITRTHTQMRDIECLLKNNNYVVVNRDYPSTKLSIKDIADQYVPNFIEECRAQQTSHINFVTNSLGGIIVQQYLQDHPLPNVDKIVMLSPPNHGSPLADLLHNNWLFKRITGPAGQELMTNDKSTPNQIHLKQPNYKIGIITGSFNYVPFMRRLFHGPNDGAVAVASAKTDSMTDFLIVPVSHLFMPHNKLVENQLYYFLKHGQFLR